MPTFRVTPLSGKRIAITRAFEQGRESCVLWSQKGALPLLLPLIEFAPPPSEQTLEASLQQNVIASSGIVFTSRIAVQKFFFYLAKLALPKAHLNGKYLTCVGPETAKELNRFGYKATRVAAETNSKHLASLIKEDLILSNALSLSTNHHLLFPRALEGRDTLLTELKHTGIHVDLLFVYETKSCGHEAFCAALKEQRFDVLTLTSPSIVKSALTSCQHDANLFKNVHIACIGKTTREAALRAGLSVHITPELSTTSALIAETEKYFSNRKERK